MQTRWMWSTSHSLANLILIGLFWLPASHGLAAEYLSAEDALNAAYHQMQQRQGIQYLSAEDALSAANRQLLERQAARSAPAVQDQPIIRTTTTLPERVPVWSGATDTRYSMDAAWSEPPYSTVNPYTSFQAGNVFSANPWPGTAGVGWAYPAYTIPTTYGYYPVDPRMAGYGMVTGYGSTPVIVANQQAVADWLFGRPVSPRISMEIAVESAPAPTAIPVKLAAVVAPRPKPQVTPTPLPEPPTPAPDMAQSAAVPNAADQIAAAQAAYEQALYEQKLALLALETRIARQDALRWIGATIVFGLFTGGVCLYTLLHNRPKED